MALCTDCGRRISQDEAGLTRKLINRNTQQLYCLACLSRRFKVPEERLLEMIERFREAGCTLFT